MTTLLSRIRGTTLTAREAAAFFVRNEFGTARTVDPKWDGDKFRLVEGNKWYRIKITKDGFEIHKTEEE